MNSHMLKLKGKMSKAEKEYLAQLKNWNKSVAKMVDTTNNLAGAFAKINSSVVSSVSPVRPPQTPLRSAINADTPHKVPPRTPLTSASSGKKSWSTPKSIFFDEENRSSGIVSTPFSPYQVSLSIHLYIISLSILISLNKSPRQLLVWIWFHIAKRC